MIAFELDESMPWWGRLIILIFIIPVIMPFYAYEQMPTIAIVVTVALQLLLTPLILYHALWRRKVVIDRKSRNVIVSTGPILAFARREYPINYFNTFKVRTKKESIEHFYGGGEEEGFVFNEQSSVKVTETFILKGIIELEIVEYSYSHDDLETKSLVQNKRDEISYFLIEFFPRIEIA